MCTGTYTIGKHASGPRFLVGGPSNHQKDNFICTFKCPLNLLAWDGCSTLGLRTFVWLFTVRFQMSPACLLPQMSTFFFHYYYHFNAQKRFLKNHLTMFKRGGGRGGQRLLDQCSKKLNFWSGKASLIQMSVKCQIVCLEGCKVTLDTFVWLFSSMFFSAKPTQQLHKNVWFEMHIV